MLFPSRQLLWILFGAFVLLAILSLLVSGALGTLILVLMIGLALYFLAVAVADHQRRRTET